MIFQKLALAGASASLLLSSTGFADDLPRRGLLGVGLGPSPDGIAVSNVSDDSPAADAGFQTGDVLAAVGGVATTDTLSLQMALSGLAAGQATSVDIVRDGEALSLTITPDAVPVPVFDGAQVSLGHVTRDNGERIRTITLTPTEPSTLATEAGLPSVFYVQGIPCVSVENLSNPNHYRVRLFRDLIDAGFAVSFADKPGIGDSEGEPCLNGGFDREIEAFSLAAAQHRTQPGIDPERIYAIGVSMGGIQAPMIDPSGDFAGIVTWGTGVSPWFDYIATNFRMRAMIQGQPAEEAEAGLRLLRVMMADLLIDELSPDEIRTARPEQTAEFEASFGSLERFAGRHYSFHQELDNAAGWAAWQDFDGRLLAVQGEYDWVATGADHRLAVDIVNRNHPGAATYLEVPGLDHAFTSHDTLDDSFANTFQGERSELFHDAAVEWLVELAGG